MSTSTSTPVLSPSLSPAQSIAPLCDPLSSSVSVSSLSVSPPPSSDYEFSSLYGYLVHVHSCSNLVSADLNGHSDPFVIVRCAEVEYRTPVVRKSLNPAFDQMFTFVFPKPAKEIQFEVFDWDKITFGKSKSLGTAVINLSNDASVHPHSSVLFRGSVSLSGVEHGAIDVTIEYQPIPHLVGRSSASAGDSDLPPSLDELVHLIDLTLLEGRNLRSRDLFHSSDPFVVVSFGLQSFRSTVVYNNPNPIFDEFCPIWVRRSSADHLIKFSVFDFERRNAPRPIGNAFLKVRDLKLGEKIRIKLVLNHEEVKTETQLSAAMEKLGTTEEKGQNSGKQPELWVSVELKGRDQVVTEFYDHLLESYDANHNGVIEEAELLHFFLTIEPQADLDAVRAIFRSLSPSGALNRDQLLAFFRHSELNAVFPDFLRRIHALLLHGPNSLAHLMVIQTPEQTANKSKSHEKQKDYLAVNEPSDASASPEDGFYHDRDNAVIQVLDRGTGLLVQESIPAYLKSAMRLLYRTSAGRSSSHSDAVKNTLRILTLKQGPRMDSEKSKRNILPFVNTHKLNTAEIEKPIAEYKTFNDFFCRKLKAGARTCAEPGNPLVAVSPADCRALAFQSVEEAKELWIKGRNFTLKNLFGQCASAEEWVRLFNGGSLMIARLSPLDYHRFHSPVTGRILDFHPVGDGYHTVNPIAVRRDVDVYTENKRVIVPILTEQYGLVLVIVVAAAMVGSIQFTRRSAVQEAMKGDSTPDQSSNINKFDELGCFKFGGSTLLILFQPGSIEFDSDLRANTKRKLETLIKVGQSIGNATGIWKPLSISMEQDSKQTEH